MPACVRACTDPATDGPLIPRQATHGLLCVTCARRLHTWLEQIPALWAGLADVKIAGPGDGAGKTCGAGRLPLRVDVLALIGPTSGAPRDRGDELWYETPDVPGVMVEVRGWAECLRDELDPARHERNVTSKPVTVASEAAYLSAAFDRLVEQPWVDECWAALRAVHAALMAVRGETARSVGDCRCGGTVREHRSDYSDDRTSYRCSKCAETWDTVEGRLRYRISSARKRAVSA